MSAPNCIQVLMIMSAKVSHHPNIDFIENDLYSFEIGGKDKYAKQIDGIENTFIAADDIECGFQNKIPLWLFKTMV